MEEWRPVPGFPNYEASNLGCLRSVDHLKWSGNAGYTKVKGRILKTPLDGRGYPTVKLGFGKSFPVHSIILLTFVGPRPQGKYGLHRDDVKTNNALTNLYYGTPAQNLSDQYKNGIRRPEDNSLRARKAMVTRFHNGVGIIRSAMEYDL